MTDKKKDPAAVLAETVVSLLEERKSKNDRRKQPEVKLPASVERRSGKDRRSA